MVKDMTSGNPTRVLVRFTIPMLISVAFQQLYNIADSIIAGKFIGGNGLAAVGISYSITMIYMAIANGSNIGQPRCYFADFRQQKLQKYEILY